VPIDERGFSAGGDILPAGIFCRRGFSAGGDSRIRRGGADGSAISLRSASEFAKPRDERVAPPMNPGAVRNWACTLAQHRNRIAVATAAFCIGSTHRLHARQRT